MLSQTVKTRGLHAGIRFAPHALLDKIHRQKFQAKANEGFDWQRHEYAEQVWRLGSPQPEGGRRSELKLTVQPDAMTFEDSFPSGPFEVFLDNLRLTMGVIHDVFRPQLMLASGAVIRLTAESSTGDSRTFLGNHCLRMEDRLAPLGRPVHGVGLKMLLPPLPGDGPNWQASMRVESLVEDVRQIFIEVDARWGNPAPWSADEIVSRVKTAYEFSVNQVIAFLAQFRAPS